MRFFITLLATLLFTSPILAHKASDSYLSVEIHQGVVSAQWDIALRDVEIELGLDSNDDGAITWGELRASHSAIADWATAHLTMRTDNGPCNATVQEFLVDTHTDGSYTVLKMNFDCIADEPTLEIDYRLMFDRDPSHRGLLNFVTDTGATSSIFSPGHAVQKFSLADVESSSVWQSYMREGVLHIWAGIDHILFLLSLLLPAVLLRKNGVWMPVNSFSITVRETVKTVTAFTFAHSLTLCLAALEIIQFSSRWVESAIAVSVIIAAMNNIVPFIPVQRWVMALVFGLVHGLGFASVLSGLGLTGTRLVEALIGFNLGVEAGQLMIVLIFLPLAYLLRRSWFYRTFTLHAGSLAIAFVACIWLLERSLDLSLL